MSSYLEGIKGIIFDYGGTLDTGGDHWSLIIRRAYEKASVDIDEAQFREAYVFAERELARTRYILPEHDFNDLLTIKINIELQWLAEHDLFPPENVAPYSKKIANICYEAARRSVENATPVLKALSEKYPLVLVSNFYGNINTVLKDFGIDSYFTKVVESAVVGVRKPDPEIFRLGVSALELQPDEVLVVGDSYSKDILPALKAGCHAVWLKGKGWTAEEDKIAYPDTISSLSELL